MYKTVFLGPPGSGKGSQAKFVVDRYGLQHISTGELLRDAVANKTPVGQKAAEIMSRGNLVPDELVVDLVSDHLIGLDAEAGFILDGFPRSLAQAEALQEILERNRRDLAFVLHLHVDLEAVVKRLSGRRTCAQCGEIFNIYFKPTAKEGVCDVCGHTELLHRADDHESSIRQRLDVYDAQTRPLLSFYEQLGLLRTVEAAGSESEVARSVEQVFQSASG